MTRSNKSALKRPIKYDREKKEVNARRSLRALAKRTTIAVTPMSSTQIKIISNLLQMEKLNKTGKEDLFVGNEQVHHALLEHPSKVALHIELNSVCLVGARDHCDGRK